MAQDHYLWYDATGEIKGLSLGHEAWDGDPLGTPDAGTHAKNCQDNQLTDLGMTGGFIHSCACDLGDYDCPHAAEGINLKYVDDPLGTPALTDKPALTILVDAVSHGVNDRTPINKTPGASVTLKLQATVPDGTEILLRRDGASVYGSDPTLTFTSNETNEITLTAPNQGELGGLLGTSKLMRPVVVPILGWA